MAVILKIGNVDLSDYAEVQQVSISTAPVWDSVTFRSVTGAEHKKCLGESVQITANFSVLPEKIARDIMSACDADEVVVQYKEPRVMSAAFDRPSVTRNPDFEEADGVQRWNVSVSMSCPLRGYGL